MDVVELDNDILKMIDSFQQSRVGQASKEINFIRPVQTVPISVTGHKCSLNCAHCGGQYLKHMIDPETGAKRMDKDGITSSLVSGGSDKGGSLRPDIDTLRSLAEKGKINVHLGLANEEYMKEAAPFIDCVSFDFVVDDETIREVYNLDKRGEDYIESFKAIRKYVRVVPHICIGLYGGVIKGEYKAVDCLKDMDVDELVLIVFIPTPGTRYESRKPPLLVEVVEFMIYARENLPDANINLGCMKPGKAYRSALDCYALEAGLNGIVNPAHSVIKRAKDRGYIIHERRECCVL